jgi:predicted  nucleic acid-binding Zn-ribbon protein
MAASAVTASVAASNVLKHGERELKFLRAAARSAKKRVRALKDELKTARKSAKQARKQLRRAVAAHKSGRPDTKRTQPKAAKTAKTAKTAAPEPANIASDTGASALGSVEAVLPNSESGIE